MVRAVEPEHERATHRNAGDHARRVDRDLLIVALAILLAAAALQVTPARDGVTLLGWRLPETCLTKRVLGRECAGCGLTRSFVVGVRGDLVGAAQLHPLGAALLVLFAAQVPYRAARLLAGPRADHARGTP